MHINMEKYCEISDWTVTLKMLADNSIELYKYGVIYLGADTFRQNETFEIIDFIRNKGFNIIKSKLKANLTRTEIENMFLPNNSCVKCGKFRWWMVESTLMQSPILTIMVFKQDATKDNHCLKQLNAMKGHGNPYIAHKGSIRECFSAINYSMNMIHIPDNYEDFIKDLSPFYSVKELENVLIKNFDSNNKCENYLTEDDMYEISLLLENSVKADIFNSIFNLKFRILKNINIENDYKVELLKMFREIVENSKGKSRQEKKEIMININKKEIELLESIEKVFLKESLNLETKKFFSNDNLIKDINKINILRKLIYIKHYNEIKETIFNNLKDLNIYISDFEKNLLLTSILQWD